MSEPKRRHHYVPRLYLKRFASDRGQRQLCEYDKETGRFHWKHPAAVGWALDYHTLVDREGRSDTDTIENALSSMESNAARAITRIERGDPLDQRTRSALATFVGFSISRAPQFRRNLEDFEVNMKEWGVELARAVQARAADRSWQPDPLPPTEPEGEPLDLSWDELERALADDSYQIKPNEQHSLRVIALGGRFGELIDQMRWQLHRAPPGTFYVTGDNPVAWDTPLASARPSGLFRGGVGLASPELVISFPITQRVALVAGHMLPDEGPREALRESVDYVNRLTISSASRYVYAPAERADLAELARRHRGSAPTWTFDPAPRRARRAQKQAT